MVDPGGNWTKVRDSSGNVLFLSTVDLFAAAWSTWTPVLVQGVTPTITIQYANYTTIGKTRIAQAMVTATSTGTVGSEITCTLPPGTPAAGNNIHIGSGRAQTGAAAVVDLPGGALFITRGDPPTLGMYRTDIGQPTGRIGVDPANSIQNGDRYQFSVMYELA